MRTEHLRTLSHDLRTPLTAIKGFGEWLLINWDSTPDERKRQLVDRIVDAGGRLDQMVQGLLELARLERGALQVDLAPHRLSELVEDTLRQLAATLENHAVDVRLDEDATVLVDRDAMVRVMENLLTNAAKFSPPGSTVHITAQAAPGRLPSGRTGRADDARADDAGAGGDTVLLSVRDEGMGIDAGEQERVFDRFYRVPSVDTSPGTRHRARAGQGVRRGAGRLRGAVLGAGRGQRLPAPAADGSRPAVTRPAVTRPAVTGRSCAGTLAP